MTETEKIVEKFIRAPGGSRYREIFQTLESNHLRPLGKSNTKTLLFQFRGADGTDHDVLAFRLGPPSVMSFPKSHWLSRTEELNQHLGNFSYSERPATTGPVSDSQFSAGQIELNRSTHERVIEVCTRICDGLA